MSPQFFVMISAMVLSFSPLSQAQNSGQKTLSVAGGAGFVFSTYHIAKVYQLRNYALDTETLRLSDLNRLVSKLTNEELKNLAISISQGEAKALLELRDNEAKKITPNPKKLAEYSNQVKNWIDNSTSGGKPISKEMHTLLQRLLYARKTGDRLEHATDAFSRRIFLASIDPGQRKTADFNAKYKAELHRIVASQFRSRFLKAYGVGIFFGALTAYSVFGMKDSAKTPVKKTSGI